MISFSKSSHGPSLFNIHLENIVPMLHDDDHDDHDDEDDEDEDEEEEDEEKAD